MFCTFQGQNTFIFQKEAAKSLLKDKSASKETVDQK